MQSPIVIDKEAIVEEGGSQEDSKRRYAKLTPELKQ